MILNLCKLLFTGVILLISACLVSAGEWHSFAINSDGKSFPSLIEYNHPIVEQELQFQDTLKDNFVNPPGARGMISWLHIDNNIKQPLWLKTRSIYGIPTTVSLISLNEFSSEQYEFLWIINLGKANVLWSSSSFDQRHKLISSLTKNIPKYSKQNWYQDALLQLAHMWFAVDDNSQVLSTLDKAKDGIKWSEAQQWHRLWLIANSMLNIGQFEEASKLFNTLIEKIQSTNLNDVWKRNLIEIKSSAFIAKSLSAFYILKTDLPAVDQIIEAMDEAIELDDAMLISDVLYAQAINQSMQNNGAESIALLDLAIELQNEVNANKKTYLFHHQKAVTHYLLNNLDFALISYRNSLAKTNPEERPFYWFGLHVSIAKIYQLLGEYSTAQRYAKRALQFYNKKNITNEMAITRQLLGQISYDLNDLNAAYNYQQLALVNFNKYNQKLAIESMVNLAQIDVKLEKFNQAQNRIISSAIKHLYLTQKIDITNTKLSRYKEVNILEMFKKLSKEFNGQQKENFITLLKKSNIVDEALTLMALTWYHTDQDEKLFQYLVSVVNRQEFDKWKITTQLSLMKVLLKKYAQKKDSLSIEQMAQKALLIINNTQNKFLGTDTALHWTDQAQSLIDIYINSLIRQSKAEQAFQVAEQQHAVNWRKRHIQSVFAKHIQNNNEKLKSYIDAVKSVVISNNELNKKELDLSRELFLQKTHSHEKLRSTSNSLEALSIEAIQAQLNVDEVVIRYIINENPHVFIITRRKWLSEPLPDSLVLKNLSTIYVKKILSKAKDYEKWSKELSMALRLNVDLLIGKTKLILVTDGELASVPFAALTMHPYQERYRPLIKDLQIIHTPSLSVYAQQKERQYNIFQTAAVVSNPIYLSELLNDNYNDRALVFEDGSSAEPLLKFAKLPHTQKEAEIITGFMSGLDVIELNREYANNENIISEQIRYSDIIHFATHGVFAETSMDHVGLATSVKFKGGFVEGGFLSSRELFSYKYSAKLVVVSGCETIQGKQIDGEGLLGLANGFLAQGSESVLATIWAIPDIVTPHFMNVFYQSLLHDQKSISQSLNDAQNILFESRYKHPYYWASFVLTSSIKI